MVRRVVYLCDMCESGDSVGEYRIGKKTDRGSLHKVILCVECADPINIILDKIEERRTSGRGAYRSDILTPIEQVRAYRRR